LLILFCCQSMFGQSVSSQNGWTVKDPFKSQVIIENKGQFNKGQSLKPVLYAVDDRGMHIYFSKSGFAYDVINFELKNNSKEGQEKVHELYEEAFHKDPTNPDLTKIEKYFINKSAFINV